MIDYREQLERIKAKLPIAQKTDKKLKVFGADTHKYVLNKPVSEADIIRFETLYSISLPECYKSFLLYVGNGGSNSKDAGAGPYYGLYPFGTNVDELVYRNLYEHLKNDCIVSPRMSDEYWSSLVKVFDNDNLSDDELDAEQEKLFGGILPIGNQGCAYLHGIVLNGQYKGRIVNLDLDKQKPHFCFENNFLDWYERWLDEIISGELITKKAAWFGYTMGGSEEDILEKLSSSIDTEDKKDYLHGILNKESLKESTITIIEEQLSQNQDDELKKILIKILCKFNHDKAKPYLIDLMQTDLLSVFQFIFWYAKDKSSEWVSIIEANIQRINDPETFRFCVYILEESNSNYRNLLLPFAQNNNTEIRDIVFHTLEKLSKKSFFRFFR